MTNAQDQVPDARRLLMLTASLGVIITDAVARAAGADLASNPPVLVLLSLDDRGPLRPNQLQELTGLSSGGVSKLLDRLQDAGLITREYGVLATDRRGSLVRLTAQGRDVSHRMAEEIARSSGELKVLFKEFHEFLDHED